MGSTNDQAKRLAVAGAPEGTLVWARIQSAGRGRHGRVWISQPGNLHCSLILRPECGAAEAVQLSFAAAVALGGALVACAPDLAAARYKWPNDVLIQGRKIAGILLESQPDSAGAIDWLIVGLGVNVVGFPEGTDWPATSLHDEGCEAADAAKVLEAFAEHFHAWLMRWRSEGFAPVREAWLEGAAALGQPVEVRLGGNTLHGTFIALDARGALVLETGDGQRHTITAGTLFFPGAG